MDSTIIVALIGTLTTMLALLIPYWISKKNRQESNVQVKTFDNDGDAIKSANSNVQVKTFSNVGDYYNEVADAIKNADSRVCDLTYGYIRDTVVSPHDEEFHKKYIESIRAFCYNSKAVYFEVFSFPDTNRREKAKMMLENKPKNYRMKCYNITPDEHIRIPPLLQFYIVDNKHLFLGSHLGSNLGGETIERYLQITENEEIINYFQRHFDAIWAQAQNEIKNLEELDKVLHDIGATKSCDTLSYEHL